MIDKGDWSVCSDSYSGSVYIQSSDFNYDAQFRITGDFTDKSERLKYAKHIADRLNKTKGEGND